MTAQLLFYNVTCICFFILAFIALFNPAKVNIEANRWLGLFFASVGCMLMNVIINNAGVSATYPRLIGFNELSRFAMPPALYLSIVQFTTPGSRFKLNNYLHFIPFAIFFLYMVPALYFPEYKLITRSHFALPASWGFIMAATMQISVKLQLLFYWVLAFLLLYRHQKNIQLVASNILPVNLKWLKYMLISIGAMLLLFYISLFSYITLPAICLASGYLLGGLIILYYSLAQKEVYPFQIAELKAIQQVIAEAHSSKKSSKQRLPDDQSQQLKGKLEKLMTTDKLYLDNDLSLPQLADSMALSVHDLSFLLNEKIGINFFQFVNTYRVEEAKQLMLSEEYKHLNLLGIAYSAGFSSKTTFNTVFKKQTGMSPSKFIQQAKGGLPAVASI